MEVEIYSEVKDIKLKIASGQNAVNSVSVVVYKLKRNRRSIKYISSENDTATIKIFLNYRSL